MKIETKRKSNAGRPDRSQWEKIQIVAWVAYVRDYPGSPWKTNEEFWIKYGDYHNSRYPSTTVVEEIEKIIPSASNFYKSSLWEISFYENFGFFPIKNLFKSLHPDLLNFWVEDNWESLHFWRRHRDMEIEREDIEVCLFGKNNYLDGLLAISVLMHEAIAHQNKKRFKFFKEYWKESVHEACKPDSNSFGFPDIQVESYLANFGMTEIAQHSNRAEKESKFFLRQVEKNYARFNLGNA